jgi:hypothetical protein
LWIKTAERQDVESSMNAALQFTESGVFIEIGFFGPPMSGQGSRADGDEQWWFGGALDLCALQNALQNAKSPP